MDVGQFQGFVEATLGGIARDIAEIKTANVATSARLGEFDSRCADHRVEIGERFAAVEAKTKNGNGAAKKGTTMSPLQITLGAGALTGAGALLLELGKIIAASIKH